MQNLETALASIPPFTHMTRLKADGLDLGSPDSWEPVTIPPKWLTMDISSVGFEFVSLKIKGPHRLYTTDPDLVLQLEWVEEHMVKLRWA